MRKKRRRGRETQNQQARNWVDYLPNTSGGEEDTGGVEGRTPLAWSTWLRFVSMSTVEWGSDECSLRPLAIDCHENMPGIYKLYAMGTCVFECGLDRSALCLNHKGQTTADFYGNRNNISAMGYEHWLPQWGWLLTDKNSLGHAP